MIIHFCDIPAYLLPQIPPTVFPAPGLGLAMKVNATRAINKTTLIHIKAESASTFLHMLSNSPPIRLES